MYTNDRVIVDDNNETGASVLTISNVRKNDTGSYLCEKAYKLIEIVHLNVVGKSVSFVHVFKL